MIIDGHAIRANSIDAVTAIVTKTDDAQWVETGNEKMVRGSFNIVIAAQLITISRSMRVKNDKAAIEKATKGVIAQLEPIRKDTIEHAGIRG